MCEENVRKIEKLSREVLTCSRNTLLVNLRFLDMALSQFEMLPCEAYSFSLRAFQGFKTVFETMKQKSLQWSNELEYSYWPKLVIEVWSPGNEEILLIRSSGEVNYSAYFNFK